MAKKKKSAKSGKAVRSRPPSQTLAALGIALATALKKDGVVAVIEQLESGLGRHLGEKPSVARTKSSKKKPKSNN